jgi:hypothetical protein
MGRMRLCCRCFRASWLFAHASWVAGRSTVDGGRRRTHGGQSSPGGEVRRHDATSRVKFSLFILETFYAMSTLPDVSLSVRRSESSVCVDGAN